MIESDDRPSYQRPQLERETHIFSCKFNASRITFPLMIHVPCSQSLNIQSMSAKDH